MDNLAIAHVLNEIADLLEIRDENPFRIRAYRNAASAVTDSGERIADLTDPALRQIPGIGKDIAGRIRELVESGQCRYHQELLAEFPPGVLDLLHLQGIGPKTVALLYGSRRIQSVDELEQAARGGALRGLRGLGPKKEQLILKAIDEWRRHAGRHLTPDAWEVATGVVDYLRDTSPHTTFDIVGSLRRGADTCGDIDILACGAAPDLMAHFVRHPHVERVLGQGDTKSSVRLRKGYQTDLRLVVPESRGAALQYFTGSKLHNIELRDRALRRGWKLNEYGLFQASDGTRLAGDTEEALYAALDLAHIPPELREMRGEIDAAKEGTLPRLIELSDLRGDLHMHTTATDGRDDVETMARAAKAAGLSYIAITDHSQALAMANGLDEAQALAHARRIREVAAQIEGVTLLAGIECDIRPDGQLDLADDCLAQLDIVIASVHSAFNQSPEEMTNRVLRAMECRYVDVIGHPTGRLLLRRDPYAIHVERLIAAAAQHGVALEINSLIERRDLSDAHARLARDRGVKLVISSDAHSVRAFGGLRWGVMTARRGWIEAKDVLNTLPLEALRRGLRRSRKGKRGKGVKA
ncbi:MAG: DNA polymerase/3'-5' exonuclease PolX [Luteitalea sp.]|nr:DNA polymerase/3'-5' exonuclease PolX [Luteitalea sp.]